MERNITFVGYHSKKASYSFLFVAIAILIIAACCYIFAEESKKFASIPVAIIGIVFLFGFCNLLKMPNIILEVEDDKLIHFYDVHDVKTIDLDKVQSVHYWPATISSIKITFLLDDPVNYEHFSFLVKNSKEVKKILTIPIRKLRNSSSQKVHKVMTLNLRIKSKYQKGLTIC